MSLLDDIKSDLGEIININDFAKSVTYTPFGGSGVVINVIFDDPHEDVSPITGMIGLTNPVAYARVSDMPNAKQKDTLLIDAVVYKVIGVQPDGTGLVRLELSKD